MPAPARASLKRLNARTQVSTSVIGCSVCRVGMSLASVPTATLALQHHDGYVPCLCVAPATGSHLVMAVTALVPLGASGPRHRKHMPLGSRAYSERPCLAAPPPLAALE